MLNKIPKFLYVFNIAAVINLLYGQPNNSNFHGNDINGLMFSKLRELSIGIIDFLKQNQHYLNQEVSDTTPQFGATFDFIVIGAGTAGATIAARLSEISQAKILLIEAGFHENLFMDIPMIAPFLQLDNNINWNYRTKSSNKYCRGFKGNSCLWPRGRIVGGSSVLNFMIANRGGAEDYDSWAKMGNEGWAYNDVLKYFKKLETMDIPELKPNIAYHGTDGPVHITHPLFRTPIVEAFLEAANKLGYPIVDYNGKNMIGFSYLQTTIMNGTRMSSNTAYLHPVRNRKNLQMTFESTVKKVLIDPITNRAIGVELVKYGQAIRVFASKEVILCAGAIASPQLLMLSGIGSVKHLTDLGIDVIRNSPVGENLMDHVAFYGLTFIVNTSIGLNYIDNLNPINSYITDFLIKRSGPLTTPGSTEAIGFINTKHPEKRSGLPDIELLFAGNAYKDYITPIVINLKPHIRQIWNKYVDNYGWTVAAILLKPKSRGRITLLANDVNVKPEIVPNYFDDPDDVKTMIAAIRTAINISQTSTMQAFGTQFLNITYPGCDKYEYDSNAYWECAMRTMSNTIYHHSGTCKMGPREEPSAVIDPRLKVIGIQGLRVVDASIMPEIISGHICLPVYMIAEKAADMIKEEWGYLEKSQ